ncbi:Rpn family recombination-promoting nuclease/putative transposase, partial [Thiorhodococcus minor]
MTTPTPHDCFFRENFARPAIARDFLRHQLPPALLAELDLGRLRISPDTFVTEALRKVYSDPEVSPLNSKSEHKLRERISSRKEHAW